MSGLSRRTLLSAAGVIGCGMALPSPAFSAGAARAARAARTTAHSGTAEAAGTDLDTGPARAALQRLLPQHADQFRLTALTPATGQDRFRIDGSTGRIAVAATDPAAALTGVNWYLKYVCQAHISWNSSQLGLPHRLPAPHRPVQQAATVPHRFAFNDTNDGYNAPYADWAHWERTIDVLALHGCNEALITTGQEAVYHQLLQDFGYSDAEARGWLPAPSHQPWWLLQNMSGYGGPLSPELIGRRAALGLRITGRLRDLGMHPVLPGYSGMVPDGFPDRNPGARVVPQGTWKGLRRPDWLDPRTEVFGRVAAAFYRHQAELFGKAAHFKMDLLHEGGTPGDVPVSDAARAVEQSLQTARPGATWVILGWRANPRRELLQAVDTERLLIVDGLSDLDDVTDREKDWGGAPYAFGTIPNFGGRTTIGADTDRWTEKFTAWRDKPGSALTGTAYLPEAAERDPAAFELFSELAWRTEKIDRPAWFARYAGVRYGGDDPAAQAAFAALATTAYQLTTTDGRPVDSLFSHRPSLTASTNSAFDTAAFDRAFASLLDVRRPLRDSDAYRYDLTDLARQALAERARILLPQLRAAYTEKDLDTLRALSALWLKLMRLTDAMAGCHPAFLLGPWLEEAKHFGTGADEAVQLEWTARSLITAWGTRAAANDLSNYANRDWHGLMSDIHLPQWQAYLNELTAALTEGRAATSFDWYPAEDAWTRRTDAYPVQVTGDAHRSAQAVYDTLATSPYQGAASVAAVPVTFTPGSRGQVTAVFRNLNGLRSTDRVDFTLTGLDATAQGDTFLSSLGPGHTGSVSWQVTAPADPLTTPLRPTPYSLLTRFGPRGEDRVTITRRSAVYVAAPLDAGWRTYTGNEAVFGQLGDRLAINGSGQDLWKGTAQFGTAFRAGAMADGARVAVRVDSQENTGSWARAGLIVRNSLATPGAAGFLNLAVTPGQGVVLSYDTNGDGTLDTCTCITGIKAPVLLRLTRTGDALTGACSTDGGATWRTVASVTVPGTAAGQDVGFFMSATNGGSGLRGTVEFSGWALS